MLLLNPFRFGTSTPLWTPLDLTTPALLGLDDTSTVTDVGGAASQWDDLTGNGYHVTQGTAGSRPTINASSLNGLPTLTFDGSADNFEIPTAVGDETNAATHLWAFAVYKNSSSSAAVRNLLAIASGTTADQIRFALQISRTGATDKATIAARRLDGNAAVFVSATTSASTNWAMAMVRWDVAARDGFVDVNGIQADNSNTTWTSAGAAISATNPVSTSHIGKGAGSTGNYADMELATVWFGEGLPTSTEIDKMFGCYAHRYALTSLLDVSHPYKSSPP